MVAESRHGSSYESFGEWEKVPFDEVCDTCWYHRRQSPRRAVVRHYPPSGQVARLRADLDRAQRPRIRARADVHDAPRGRERETHDMRLPGCERHASEPAHRMEGTRVRAEREVGIELHDLVARLRADVSHLDDDGIAVDGRRAERERRVREAEAEPECRVAPLGLHQSIAV